jgi:hypothetical protein
MAADEALERKVLVCVMVNTDAPSKRVRECVRAHVCISNIEYVQPNTVGVEGRECEMKKGLGK